MTTLFPEKRTRAPAWTADEDNALRLGFSEGWERERIVRVVGSRTWRACLKRAGILGLERPPAHEFGPCLEDPEWIYKRARTGCQCDSCEVRRADKRKPVVFRCRECGAPNTIIGGRFGSVAKAVVVESG